MAKVFGGAALAADIAAPEALAFGAADVGALGAEAGTEAAIGGDVLGATAGGDIAAAAAEPTAEVGLEALNTQFGTFSPEVFAANTADVAAGGLGADVGAADLAAGGSGVLDTAGGDFFGGPSGDLFSGTQQPGLFDPNAIDQTTFSGPTQPPIGQGSWMDVPGGENITGQGFGAATDQPQGPMVSSSSEGGGIVDTVGPNRFDQTFNQFTTTDQGASLPTDMANRVGAVPVQTQSTTLEEAFPGGSRGIIPEVPTSFSAPSIPPIDPAALQSGSLFNTGGLVPGTGIEAQPGDFTAALTPGASQTTLTPGGFDTGIATANVAPSPQMIAGAPNYVPPGGTVPATPSGAAITSSPLAPASTAAAPAAAAAGGTDALTALRMGAAGASIISSGINIANALNQPSYTALQPSYYPGSMAATPFNPQPNAQGFPVDNTAGGGLTGGLAASRLTNGLVAGQSAQQLALSGLISPERATRLQQDYQGITEQYAQQKGVDPRTLSPAVQRVIAARALADTGLGGR